MKKLILLLACGLLFASCAPKEVREGRKIYKAYFEYILKDPSSLEIYREEYEIIEDSKVHWEINYGAKNSYGGMVRNTIGFTTLGDRMIDLDDLYGGELYTWRELH